MCICEKNWAGFVWKMQDALWRYSCKVREIYAAESGVQKRRKCFGEGFQNHSVNAFWGNKVMGRVILLVKKSFKNKMIYGH